MAEDKIQSNRIICEGGLDSTQNHINLSLNKPGSATRLVNYEPGLDGGYRRVLGYAPYDETFQEVGVGVAEGKVLGVMIFDNTTTLTTMILAARKNIADSNYALYEYDSGTGWVVIAPGFTMSATGVTKLRFAVGNDGAVNVLAIVDGVNPAMLYDGTNWTQIESTNTGANFANAGGNQAIDAPALVGFFQQTLFLGGDLDAKGVVVYSAPNAYYDFLAASGAGQLPVGFEVVQFKPFRDELFIFGSSSIKKATPDVTAGFLLKGVTNNIGCMARDSVVEVGGDLVFLAPDGFRPVSGTNKIGDTQLEVISKPIHELIRARLLGGLGDGVDSVVIRGKSQFRIFFNSEVIDAINTKGIIGGMRTPDQQNGWEFSELQGFRTSTVASQYIDGEELVIHGDYDGKVYKQESGNTLNGEDLISIYTTPYLDFGDTEIRKTYKGLTLFLKGQNNFYFTAQIEYDWNDLDVTNPPPYTIEITNGNPVYGTENQYGDGSVYGGLVKARVRKNIEGSFFSTRLTLTSYGDIPPYSIHGVVFEYKLEGRR